MNVKIAHEVFDWPELPLGLVAKHRRHRFLELEDELVLVLPREKVERIPHAPDEIAGGADLLELPFRHDSLLYHLRQVLDLVFYAGHPQRGVEIAKSALPFLELRLLEVDGVTERRMARLSLGELVTKKTLGRLLQYVPALRPVELLGELTIATEKSGVEQCGLHREVPRGQTRTVSNVSNGMADLRSRIPEHIEDLLGDTLDEGTDPP